MEGDDSWETGVCSGQAGCEVPDNRHPSEEDREAVLTERSEGWTLG